MPEASPRPNLPSLRSMSWTISAIVASAGSSRPDRAKHLEAAAVALMGKLGLEHIEAQFAGCRRVASGRHELEGRPLVDEPPNHPGTGDPVDVHALPGHPGAALEILESSVPRRRFL